MITTEKMTYVTGVVLEEAGESLTKALLKIGILDFVDIREASPTFREKLRTLPSPMPIGRLEDLIKKIDTLLRRYPGESAIPSPETLEFLEPEELEEAEREVADILGSIESLRKKADLLSADRNRLEEIRRQMEMFGSIGAGIRAQSPYSFLTLQTGRLPADTAPDLQEAIAGLPSVLLPATDVRDPVYLFITLKQDDVRVKALLDRFGWTGCEPPPVFENSSIDGSLEKKVERLRGEEEQVSEEINRKVLEERPRLLILRSLAVAARLASRIRTSFAGTDRTILFSGWLPSREKEHLEEAVRSSTSGRYYIEWNSERDMRSENITAPVKLNNPPLLRPFETLVTNYGIPEYGTIDPTPFVAASYFIMFGLMFGDAGHGIVLFIAGIIGTVTGRRKHKKTSLFELITWCGISAIITGLLFGSFFGYKLFPPLWFDYHAAVLDSTAGENARSIFDILTITIYFGIGVIAVGLVLNWVNLIIKKRWFPLVFDKGGVVGGWIYGAGVYLAFFFVRHDYRQLPPAGFILPALVLPFLFLAAKAPLEHRMRRKQGAGERFTPLTPVVFIMEWFVEVLEISSGYLANTLSFMRVAGLGIAHVSLMSAFFQIADMAAPGPGQNPGSIVILLLGNALVIGLEGLSAGIQSLRLNYYEFFSKYFTGSGRAYAPVSLDT